MIAVLVLAAFGASVLLGMSWLAEVVPDDDRRQADNDSCGRRHNRNFDCGRPGCWHQSQTGSQSGASGQYPAEYGRAPVAAAPDWLPHTLAPLAPLVILSAPRICAGRLAAVRLLQEGTA